MAAVDLFLYFRFKVWYTSIVHAPTHQTLAKLDKPRLFTAIIINLWAVSYSEFDPKWSLTLYITLVSILYPYFYRIFFGADISIYSRG